MIISVGSVLYGRPGQAQVPHVMVLDTIERLVNDKGKFDPDADLLVFKNTYNDFENDPESEPKKFKIRRISRNAPDELYFVYIGVKNIRRLTNQDERWASRRTEAEVRDLIRQRRLRASDFCCNFL